MGGIAPPASRRAVAFLYHPPTALPFWGIWVLLCVLAAASRRANGCRRFIPLGVARGAAMDRGADADRETQTFFAHISPAQEVFQRMRASYVYVSTWPWPTIAHHVVLFAVLLAAAFGACADAMGREARALLLGAAGDRPADACRSPGCCWSMEMGRWSRRCSRCATLLFVTLAMQFLCAVAGARARARRPKRSVVVRAGVSAAAAAARLWSRDRARDRARRGRRAGRTVGSRGGSGRVLR